MTNMTSPATINDRQRAMRDATAAHYDSWIARRGWWNRLEMAELQSRLKPLLHPQATVWDVGCGTGRLIPFLAAHAGQIHATDYSSASIAVLEEKIRHQPWAGRVTAGVADMGQPCAFADSSLDLVISQQAFPLVEPAARRTALGEFRRTLKEEGRLVLVVYAYPSWVFPADTPPEGVLDDTMYFRQWTAFELQRELHDAGFAVNAMAPMLCWPQLRRLGALGAWLEMAAHRRQLPAPRSAYWYAEASPIKAPAASQPSLS